MILKYWKILLKKLFGKKSIKNEKPSENFKEAFIQSGSICILCEFCGRTHFSEALGSRNGFSEGELEELQKNAEKNPNMFIAHSEYDVEFGYLNGKQIVIDCPCNELGRGYEKFIWGHRYQIAKYLKLRTEQEFRIAQMNKNDFSQIHLN